MAEHITVACELVVTPGGSSTQNRIRLSVMGETVVDDYEACLDAGVTKVVGLILSAHSRMVSKYAQTFQSRD